LCTSVGALEAALAVTDHPHSYTDLMGWSGLAFRVRWYRGDDGSLGCPSAAVGEFPEETRLVEQAIGLQADGVYDESLSMEECKGEITGSIDGGLPVIVYEPGWNCAVAYGYREGGDTLVLRDYSAPEGRTEAQPSDLPAFHYHIRGFGEPMPAQEAFLEALRYAVYHWQCLEVRRDQPPGTYYYGPAGYEKWREVIELLPGLPEDQRSGLEGAMGFVFVSLVDARRTAVTFMRDHADLLDGHARECIGRAADAYERMVQALPPGCWDDHAARNSLLEEAERLDGEAVAELGLALAAADR
jgi:hypothetical protein